MKKSNLLLFGILFSFLFIGCQENKVLDSKEEVVKETKVLSGKKLLYDYGDLQYEITFKNDTILNWNCVFGSEKGRTADERYYTQHIDNDKLFLTWIEKDGLGVNQVVNFEKDSVFAYLRIDKQIIPLKGSVKELK